MIITPRPYQYHWGIAGAVFVLLSAILVKINFVLPTMPDNWVTTTLYASQTDFGDTVMSLVSFLGSPTIVVVYAFLLFGILLLAGLRVPGIWALGAILSGQAVAALLKNLFVRERPELHLVSDGGFSFPSGHATGTALIVITLFILIFPNINNATTRFMLRWFASTFLAWVMLSRIYLQAHFLSDVLAGLGFAMAWMALMVAVYPRFARWTTTKIPLFKHDEI